MRASMTTPPPPMAATRPSRLDRRGLLAAAFGMLLAATTRRAGAAAPTAEAARGLVQEVGTKVLDVLRDDGLSDNAKLERLVALLDGPIDLELVGRLILGRHWRTASEDQRKAYLELFRAYALDTVASRLHLYEGQDFEITSARAVSESDALVTTKISDGGGRAPLSVDWRLRERDDGALVAIDVIVEQVSLIVSLRSEFSSVIERQGMDGLLDELRTRIEKLDA